jgi:hypothetical protein
VVIALFAVLNHAVTAARLWLAADAGASGERAVTAKCIARRAGHERLASYPRDITTIA